MNLRWSNIGTKYFTVYSPKMKGKKRYKRDVPLFQEVVTELEKLRSLPGNADREFVINLDANRENCNLVYFFGQIAEKAEIGEVPRPFDNMRTSRANEVRREFGTKLENLWIGHSAKIADKYYYVATDADYAAAARMSMFGLVDQSVTAKIADESK